MKSADLELAPNRRGRGCLFWCMVIFLGLPLLLIGVVLIVLGTRDAAARRQFNKRIDELRAAGSPVDNESMRLYHASLTSDETTQAWRDVLSRMKSPEFLDSIEGVPIFDGKVESPFPLPEKEWAEEATTRAFLEKWRDLHNDTMRLSINAKPVRFPITWDSVNTLLPDTQEMRGAARLLALRGRLGLYEQDAAAVRRCIDALIGCSNALAGEPILVSQLVCVAIDSMGMQILKLAVERNLLRPQDLEYLIEKVSQGTNIGQQWRLALEGERGMMLPIFADPQSVKGALGPNSPAALLPFRSRDGLFYLDILEQAVGIETENLDNFFAELEKHDAELEEKFTSRNIFAQLDTAMTGMLAPALRGAGNAIIRRTMEHRLALIAMAVQLHRNKTGSWPATLDDIQVHGVVPSSLMPPGGRQFGYVIEDGKAVLWGFDISLGETAVSPELPTVDPNEPYRDNKETWIWRLEP